MCCFYSVCHALSKLWKGQDIYCSQIVLHLQLQAITELVKGEQQPLSNLHIVTDKLLIQKVRCCALLRLRRSATILGI